MPRCVSPRIGTNIMMVMREGLSLTAIGLACGAVGSVLLSHVMAIVLFGVSPGDPAVYAGISLLLIVTAVLACWIPARRATRIDPTVALRCDG